MSKRFKGIIPCVLGVDGKNGKIIELVKEYYENIEKYAYDICTNSSIDGIPQPSNFGEAAFLGMNEAIIRGSILKEAESYGISNDEMNSAIDRYNQNHG